MTKRADRLVIRDGGGLFHEVFTETFYRPFEQATGVRIEGLASASEPTDLITEQVRTGRPDWDMSLLSRLSQATLAARGCLAPIGPPGPNLRQIPETMRDDYMSGLLIYASVLAYRRGTIDRSPPRSWSDFWDVSRFPGRRAMRRHPFDTLEQALLADGVEPHSLYPIDLDRAFASLDRIRSRVSVWWTSGDKSAAVLRDGEVELAAVWSGRAQVAAAAGAPVSWTWDQGLWTYEGFSILKGSTSLDLCRDFIEFCADAKRQATCASRLSYGPVNPGAFDHIAPDKARTLPTNPEHFHRMVQMDADFWVANKDAVMTRFEDWQARSGSGA